MKSLRCPEIYTVVLIGFLMSTTSSHIAAQEVRRKIEKHGSAASATKPVITKIAFGSCHSSKKVDPSKGIIWDTIRNEDADVFLWTGDSVYPPKRSLASVETMRELYNDMLTNTTIGYAGFRPPLGIYGTWDDHDYGGNDMGNEMTEKPERAQAFFDFLQLKEPIRRPPDQQGLYYSVDFGEPPRKVKTIFLDTRWNRGPHCIPSLATKIPLGSAISAFTRWLTAGFDLHSLSEKHAWLANLLGGRCSDSPLLGEQQWAWLQKEFRNSDAQVHIVVSSIQVLTTNPMMEGWGQFPRERRRLLQMLLRGSRGRQAVPGLVVLSGDVHHAEISDPAAVLGDAKGGKEKNTFLEVTSSGLTHYCSQPFYGFLCEPILKTFRTHRYDNVDLENQKEDMYYIGRNYGTMEIDWEEKVMEVYIHDVDGNEVLWTGERSFGTPSSSAFWTHEEIGSIAPCVDGHLVVPTMSLLVLLLVTPIFMYTCGFWKLKRRRKLMLPLRQQSLTKLMLRGLACTSSMEVDSPDNSIVG